LELILEVFKDARMYLSQKGSKQWQNGYPDQKIIADDILNGNSYLLFLDNKVVDTAALIHG
jgi:hypothetical protein